MSGRLRYVQSLEAEADHEDSAVVAGFSLRFNNGSLNAVCDGAKAVDFTERARQYELAAPSTPPTDLRALYPSYVRGQAYLAMHRGNDAAVEFQRILDHRGLNGNSPLGALAHLQIGRA